MPTCGVSEGCLGTGKPFPVAALSPCAPWRGLCSVHLGHASDGSELLGTSRGRATGVLAWEQSHVLWDGTTLGGCKGLRPVSDSGLAMGAFLGLGIATIPSVQEGSAPLS